MKKRAIWTIVLTVLLSFVVSGHAEEKEWTVLYSSGFEKGDPKSLSKAYDLVDDPAGADNQVLLGEVSAPEKYRLFKVPFSDLDGRTVHISFRACSPDGVRAALALNRNNDRQRFKLIDKLPEDWAVYEATVEITGNEKGFIEIVAPSSWGAPPGKAYLDDIEVKVEKVQDAEPEPAPAPVPAAVKAPAGGAPNILFITMDDMNWDSMGAYGCPIPEITPHMDRLAADGVRFQYAYNQTSSCVPSRNTYQCGRYPHTTGQLSFYNVDADFKNLPQLMREAGYFTACVNKPRDSSLTDDYELYWDYNMIMTGGPKRGAPNYAKHMKEALEAAAAQKQPFYCVVNIADPHKPFYNDPAGVKKGFDEFAPSIKYTVNDVSIPAFLPEHPEIKEEMRNYYNSVKRGDDCVGAVLATLEESGQAGNTVIIFISDHGMPLPYAKSSLYPDGLRTPWIAVWPGKIDPGTVNTEHLISSVDFMPTVLDIAGIEHPEGLQGRSVMPLIQGEDDPARSHIFAEFNDNAGGVSYPMRAIHMKDYVYIFNAWGGNTNEFVSASTWHLSEKVMKRMATSKKDVAERYEFLRFRCVDEFYDLSQDPHALVNLIDDPDYQERVSILRSRLRQWMVETDDYLLEAFDAREDPDRLQEIYLQLDAAALERAETLEWKRWKNRAGGVGGTRVLYKAD